MFKSNRDKEDFGVKRVLQKDDHYICGMCGKKFLNFANAQACLERDMDTYLAASQVRETTEKHGLKKYRCRHCRRLYATPAQAQECAALCKEKIAKRLAVEKSLRNSGKDYDQKLAVLAKLSGSAETVRAIAKRAEAMKGIGRKGNYFICQLCGKQYIAVMEARACVKSHMRAPDSRLKRGRAAEVPPEIEQPSYPIPHDAGADGKTEGQSADMEGLIDELSPAFEDESISSQDQSAYTEKSDEFDTLAIEDETFSGAPLPERSDEQGDDKATEMQADSSRAQDPNYEKALKINAKKDKDKFIRNGARYVCRACNEKYFTKMEVINCFDKHLGLGIDQDSSNVDSVQPDPSQKPSTVEDNWDDAFEESETFSGSQADANQESQNQPGPEVSEAQKFERNGSKYVCKKCKQAYFTKQEVIDCFDSDCLSDPQSIGTWSGESTEDPADVASSAGNSDGGDRSQEQKFTRDGAKYVCKACGKRHFTKAEVITCFDSH